MADRRIVCIATYVTVVVCAACATGGRQAPGSPAAAPAAAPSIQQLYESGRDREIVSRLTERPDAVPAADLWFAARSYWRLGQQDDGAAVFLRLTQTADPAMQAAAGLALATQAGDRDALERARTAAAAYPDNPFVLYELGFSYASQNDYGAAAQAFDACIERDRLFAYAYYYAALAYERLDRNDLMVARLETFVRLAPNAPERPQADSILRTVRAR